MLAAAHRLRRSTDFAAAIRGGRRASRGSVVAHLLIPEQSGIDQPPTDLNEHPGSGGTRRAPCPDPVPASDEPARPPVASWLPARAGFVVSKAVGGAVVRNRVRRRLRHLVSERLGQLPPGATLVVRALPSAAGTTYRQLGADLDAAVRAARAPRAGRGARRQG